MIRQGAVGAGARWRARRDDGQRRACLTPSAIRSLEPSQPPLGPAVDRRAWIRLRAGTGREPTGPSAWTLVATPGGCSTKLTRGAPVLVGRVVRPITMAKATKAKATREITVMTTTSRWTIPITRSVGCRNRDGRICVVDPCGSRAGHHSAISPFTNVQLLPTSFTNFADRLPPRSASATHAWACEILGQSTRTGCVRRRIGRSRTECLTKDFAFGESPVVVRRVFREIAAFSFAIESLSAVDRR